MSQATGKWMYGVVADIMGMRFPSREFVGTTQSIEMAVAVPALIAVLGTMQWAVLQAISEDLSWRWWVVATLVGLGLGWAVSLVVDQALGILTAEVWRTALWKWGLGPFAVLGAVVGTAQWLVLRKRVSQAGWWVLASVVGWGIGLGVGMPLAEGDLWLRTGVFGVVLGAITGTVVAVWASVFVRREYG